MKIQWLSIIGGVALLGLTATAHSATYNLDYDGSGDCATFNSNGRSSSSDPLCWSSMNNSQIAADELGDAGNFDDSSLLETTEAYKFEVGGSESGYAAGLYSSTITTNSAQGETVTITFIGDTGEELNCPTCYFTVKDGTVADPRAILIDLADWNGLDTLVFTNIFNEKLNNGGQIGNGGTISNFRILTTEVPLPAAAWLFGSGLIGLAGIARKRKAA